MVKKSCVTYEIFFNCCMDKKVKKGVMNKKTYIIISSMFMKEKFYLKGAFFKSVFLYESNHLA